MKKRILRHALVISTTLWVMHPSFTLAGEPVAHLYWADTETGVWRAEAEGQLVEQVAATVADPMRDSEGIAVDAGSGWMYYRSSPGSEGILHRATLDGSQREILATDLVPSLWGYFELDAAGGKLYFIQSENSIQRIGVDGSDLETLVGASGSRRALGLDLAAGRIYYQEGGFFASADLDGSSPTTLGAIASYAVDIEIDSANSMAYVSYLSLARIDRCDLTFAICVQATDHLAGEIALSGSTVYFTDVEDRALWRMDLDGSNAAQVSPDRGFGRQVDYDLAAQKVYSIDEGIYRFDFDGSNGQGLVHHLQNTEIHDVAVDPALDRLFVADGGGDVIAEVDLQTGLVSPVVAGPYVGNQELSDLRGIAFDASTGLVYWANHRDAGSGGIGRAAVDGSGATMIVTGIEAPHDVALDLTHGKVYWTEGACNGCVDSAIRRANLDGSEAEDVVLGLSAGIRGIDVDPESDKIYWTDHMSNEIWWANLDGGSPGAILSLSSKPHDVAVDSAAGTLYWVEGISDSGDPTASIRSSGLDGAGPSDVITGLSGRIRDLTLVYHESLAIFDDGFESGDTSAWSSSIP